MGLRLETARIVLHRLRSDIRGGRLVFSPALRPVRSRGLDARFRRCRGRNRSRGFLALHRQFRFHRAIGPVQQLHVGIVVAQNGSRTLWQRAGKASRMPLANLRRHRANPFRRNNNRHCLASRVAGNRYRGSRRRNNLSLRFLRRGLSASRHSISRAIQSDKSPRCAGIHSLLRTSKSFAAHLYRLASGDDNRRNNSL